MRERVSGTLLRGGPWTGPHYIFSDRLGSYRTLTDSSGNMKGESDYYPFGGERVISSTVTDNFRFAGMEWDSEDGLNHTRYRQYTSAQCRWETPDRKRGCVNFLQGQNLYAYVKDNPTNLIDLLGLGDDPISGEDPCGGTGWESSAGCQGPWGTGGGYGGDLGPGDPTGMPDCDPSCCDGTSETTCTYCNLNCDDWGPTPSGSGKGQCTALYSGEGQAMFLGDLCKDKADHPVLQYSWQCTSEGPNGKDCCLDKSQAASDYCDKPHEGIGWESDLGGYSVADKYGCCCGRRKNQIYPPVPPGPGKPY